MVRTRTVWPVIAHVGIGPVALGVTEGPVFDVDADELAAYIAADARVDE